MQGINVSNINWQMIESADPIEFTLRYVGKDTTLESLKELRRLISAGESASNEVCHKLCQWIIENGKAPSPQSKRSIEEKKLGVWLHEQKHTIQGGGKFYPSNLKIAEYYKLNKLFKINDLEEKSNSFCHDYFQFYLSNGFFPKDRSDDKNERYLAIKMYDLKNAYKNNGKTSTGTKFYISNLSISKDYGFKDFFEPITKESLSNEKCHKICNWIIENNRTPNKRSADKIESQYGTWLQQQRQNKKIEKKGRGFYYQSNQEIAKSYGLNNLFDHMGSIIYLKSLKI